MSRYREKREVLELLLLGVALGNPPLRKRLPPELFTNFDVQAVVAELTTARGRTDWPCLKRFLIDWCACDWKDDGRVKPLDAMIARQTLEADAQGVLDVVGEALRGLAKGHVSDDDLRVIAELLRDKEK